MRILVAAFAVVLALALLIVGAIALFGAMNSSDGPASTASASPAQPKTQQSSAPAQATAPDPAAHAIVVVVTGPSANVTVATSDNTKVLYRGPLNHGEFRVYDADNLVVTVDEAQYVNVYVRGALVSQGKSGKQFFSD